MSNYSTLYTYGYFKYSIVLHLVTVVVPSKSADCPKTDLFGT